VTFYLTAQRSWWQLALHQEMHWIKISLDQLLVHNFYLCFSNSSLLLK